MPFTMQQIMKTIGDVLMLGVATALVVVLSGLARKTRKLRAVKKGYVLLYRDRGNAVPIGTFMFLEDAVTALHKAACAVSRVPYSNPLPEVIASRIGVDGLSWKARLGDRNIHIWVSEVRSVNETIPL